MGKTRNKIKSVRERIPIEMDMDFPTIESKYMKCYFCRRKPPYTGSVFYVKGTLPELACPGCKGYIREEILFPGTVHVKHYRSEIKK